MNLQDFYTPQQAAQALNISIQTLKNWEKANKITVFRHPINNYRFYKKSDIQELLEKINIKD